MEVPDNSTESASEKIAEKFKALYGVALEKISYEALPQYVVEYFESQASKYIPEDSYTVANFDHLYTFAHENGDVTYVASEEKTYGEESGGDTERLSYFADTREGHVTGYLEVRLSLSNMSEYFKDKPFVGITRTHEAFRKQGLARRRLEEANAYSLSVYDLPLHSDALLSEIAQRTWESLVAEGKAEQYEEGEDVRFRFVV